MDPLPESPFALTRLHEIGLSPRRLRALIERGEVRRVMQGVFVAGTASDTVELRAAAAMLAMPPHAVVCDRSAAWLHGVDCFDHDEHPSSHALEVVAIDEKERARRPGVYGGKRTLFSDDICEVNGVRVTTPARTAADLARLRGRHTAIAVLDAFARQYGVSNTDHARLLRRLRGHRGVIQYRALAPLADPRAESFAESWTRIEILDQGLPAPVPQFWVELPGFGSVRLDLAYPQWRIAIEYDGEEFHSSPEDREADRRRREALEAAGWIVLVVTKQDLRRESGGAWLLRLSEAVNERRLPRRRVYSRGANRDFARTRR